MHQSQQEVSSKMDRVTDAKTASDFVIQPGMLLIETDTEYGSGSSEDSNIP